MSLDQLKKAIEAMDDIPLDFGHKGSWEQARADAWRAAFEWLNGIVAADVDEIRMDYDEGMRLIRERLT